MADHQTQPTPDPSTLDPAMIQRLLRQTLNPQPVAYPQQPTASSHEGRGARTSFPELVDWSPSGHRRARVTHPTA